MLTKNRENKVKMQESVHSYVSIEEQTYVEELSQELLCSIDTAKQEMREFYRDVTQQADYDKFEEEVKQKIRSYRRAILNIVKANQQLVVIRDEFSARWNDLTRKKRRLIPSAPANAVIDLAENQSNHFARGINGYKLLLICFMGSFFGVIIEILWCLLKNGYIESRSGLVYGPFNLLYGFGAVVLTLALYRFRNNGKWLSFIGGFLAGSLVEYLCSWCQETVFDSRSWDYSAMPFNVNGRICLLYSVFWGALGVIWMKVIYPWISSIILKMPNKAGKIITWIFLIFFIVNITASIIAVFRWSQRMDGAVASNGLWRFIDVHFPDSRMEKIYPNMVF